jgi:hypothetical protein
MVTGLALTLVGPADPQAGARLGVEVAWTNNAATAVRVPSDWASHLTVDATYYPTPDEKPATAASLAAFQPRGASEVKWMTVPAGGRLTANTDLSSLLPRRCTPGCAPGQYVIDASMEPRVWTGLEADQVQPDASGRLIVLVRPGLLPAGPDALAIKAAPKVEGAALQAALTLKNTTDHAVWIPSTWSYQCTSQWDGGGAGAGVGFGGQGSFGDETSRTRLGAGKSLKVSLPCGDPPPAGAKSVTVAVTLAPMTKFWPKEPHPGDGAFEGEIAAK